jgi:hypothetical protein
MHVWLAPCRANCASNWLLRNVPCTSTLQVPAVELAYVKKKLINNGKKGKEKKRKEKIKNERGKEKQGK